MNMQNQTENTSSPSSMSSSSPSPSHRLHFLSKFQLATPITSTSISSELTTLSDSYKPTDYDVICGRGKGSYNQPGNKRLRALIRDFIPEYTKARSKFDKTTVLSQIVDAVKAQNSHTTRFIKSKNGVWFEISDDQAREKVGHTMRETIALLTAKSTNDMAYAESKARKANQTALLVDGFSKLRRCSKLAQLKQAQLPLTPAS